MHLHLMNFSTEEPARKKNALETMLPHSHQWSRMAWRESFECVDIVTLLLDAYAMHTRHAELAEKDSYSRLCLCVFELNIAVFHSNYRIALEWMTFQSAHHSQRNQFCVLSLVCFFSGILRLCPGDGWIWGIHQGCFVACDFAPWMWTSTLNDLSICSTRTQRWNEKTGAMP